MGRSKSSKRWLAEHFDDPFVKQAQKEGLRSRSAFKLRELHDRYHLIEPGMTIVDLGCAPGGWSQVAASIAGGRGRVIGLDVLPMEPLPDVEILLGDFTEKEPLAALERALDGGKADLVLSDMAPNMSGMAVIDQVKAMYLAELVLDFAGHHLRSGGKFLVKLFQGEGFDAYVREVRSRFDKVSVRKPDASRARSREVYLLALGHRVK